MKFYNNRTKQDLFLEKKILPSDNYHTISFLNGFFDIDLKKFKNLILILPYTECTLWDSKKHAWQRLVDDSLYDNLGSCISIFVVEPDLVDIDIIASVINNVDKQSQVDTIWVYPSPQKKTARRINDIDKLPFQLSNEY